MRRYQCVFILFILSACLAGLRADGFATLSLGSDARTTGMGLTASALAEGGAVAFWNPAAVGFIDGRHLELSLHRWMNDIQSEFVGLAYGNSRRGFAGYLLFTDIGQLEHRRVPSEQPIGLFGAYEMSFGLSYGRQIISNLYAGISVKAFYEKIYFYETRGLGADIGVLYLVPYYHVRVAGVLQNIGKTGHFSGESIPLPLTGKLGLLIPIHVWEGQWILTGDWIKERAFSHSLHLGTEYCWRSLISIRSGIMTGNESIDMTYGFGIIRNRIRLDYSYMPIPALGNSHRLSFGYSW
jgi:hypothetical protein